MTYNILIIKLYAMIYKFNIKKQYWERYQVIYIKLYQYQNYKLYEIEKYKIDKQTSISI